MISIPLGIKMRTSPPYPRARRKRRLKWGGFLEYKGWPLLQSACTLCRHIYNWNIVECHVKQPISFFTLMTSERYRTLSRTPTRSRKRKRKRSDSVLWQKPLHQQKCHKGKNDNTNNAKKSLITGRLRTDLGRSVGVTMATQLVWLTWFTGQTFPPPQQPCNQKDTRLKNL